MKNKKLFAILTLVCFMMTLMPVAAFAAPVANSNSVVWTEDTDVNAATETSKFNVKITDAAGDPVVTTDVYVWVTRDGSSVPVNTVVVSDADNGNTQEAIAADKALVGSKLVWTLDELNGDGGNFWVRFFSTGSYKVHASATKPEITSGKIASADEFNATTAVVTVTTPNATVEALRLDVTLPNAFNYAENAEKYATEGAKTPATGNATTGYTARLADGGVASALEIEANNVDEQEVVIELGKLKANGITVSSVSGKTLKISTAGAIDVDKESVTTDALGQAKFKVSGSAEGTYKIYVTYGQFETVIEVQVGSTLANTIECTDEPTNPIDILNENLDNGELGDYVTFEMYDVNGNKVAPKNAGVNQGWDKAAQSKVEPYTGYVAVVSQPAGSKLENKNLWFNGNTICSNKAITKEGTYEFKVVLNNGNYATATIEVKEFTTPVKLVVDYPEAIELGTTVGFSDLYWLDANNVEKKAYNTTTTTVGGKEVVEVGGAKVTLAATGYAISNYDSTTGSLTAKSDEKYVGNEITITAVDERYNLVATDVVTVADDAKELKFADKTAEVKVNNKIRVNVVDSQGKVVTLGGDAEAQNASVAISYVILDKPENARVFVSTAKDKLLSDGYFDMNLTSNVVGNVTVQAVVKYSYKNTEKNNATVVKYYTGTQIFAVGNGSVGDVVVMSINSNEIVINDKKATIDAAPIVKNDRTFVPFRALAEAFGAEVAYDEATQAVTAELNGVKVVMTIGSATYTVNGAEKTMDVAPFINGSRTMVPVRFVAESFGIKVIPTYDENGATADILFNL